MDRGVLRHLTSGKLSERIDPLHGFTVVGRAMNGLSVKIKKYCRG
jgi:hypothetical protein